MTRALAAGCAAAATIVAAILIAFLLGVGPAEHLIERETLHHI